MTDESAASGNQASSPLSDQAFDQDGPGTRDRASASGSGVGPTALGDRSAFALEMTQMWIREHQTTSMLGAFAVGVFIGAYLRD